MQAAHPPSGSLSTWFLVELEFGNVSFWGEGKTGVPREKPLGARERTKNKLNSYGVDAGIWTRAKLVGGECSHHCATLAPWKQGRLLNRASKITNFPPDFLFTSERPHYSLALISSFICTCTTSKRNKFYPKRTLDYLPKKYPEYAINWLVSQIAVRAETVNVTVHPLGCNT